MYSIIFFSIFFNELKRAFNNVEVHEIYLGRDFDETNRIM